MLTTEMSPVSLIRLARWCVCKHLRRLQERAWWLEVEDLVQDVLLHVLEKHRQGEANLNLRFAAHRAVDGAVRGPHARWRATDLDVRLLGTLPAWDRQIDGAVALWRFQRLYHELTEIEQEAALLLLLDEADRARRLAKEKPARRVRLAAARLAVVERLRQHMGVS